MPDAPKPDTEEEAARQRAAAISGRAGAACIFTVVALILLIFMAPARGFERVSITATVTAALFAASAYVAAGFHHAGYGEPGSVRKGLPHGKIALTVLVFLTLIHL